MSRTVKEVLDSGYLTPAEDCAIKFERALEANEHALEAGGGGMAKGAALAVTCEQQGVALEDCAFVRAEIPDGDWWEAKHLPVRDDAEDAEEYGGFIVL